MVKRRRRGPGRPPASERRRSSREALLDAGAKVFAARGYRAASVDEILTEAGLSKGTFYWHYGSKHELFLALLEERVDRPVRTLMGVTGAAPAEATTAPVVSRGLAELFEQQRELVLLQHEYWSTAVRDPQVGESYRQRQAALRDTLARALAARHERTGVPLTVPAPRLATAFMALAEGLSLEALADPDHVDRELFGEIVSLVYDGLAARASRGP
jgi:AcrR family transcriptional regulator